VSPFIIVLPILLPVIAAAVLLFLAERHRRLASLVNMAATVAGLVVAVLVLLQVNGSAPSGATAVYLSGNWEAPIGIVLVADRLSALMLVLVGIVGVCAALYAEGAWARAGVYFHPLFQVQLMGLNGAFLTGDLFNLFVFFEVMLAASYGLQLHGSGGPRVRSGVHYIAVNLLASSLFLVGLAVLYGVTGTLTMADVAAKIALVPVGDRGLLYAGATILAVAFLIKAAIWPLNAWLVPAYMATSAPVAALFALMTKVGIYALLRLWTLIFSADTGPSAHFGGSVLLYGGLATLAFGALGLVASTRIGRIGAFSIIVSSGTLLAAVAIGTAAMTAAALFYLVSATLAVSALFLLVELLGRIGTEGQPLLPDVDIVPGEDTNLDDEEVPLVGRTFPGSTALLGLTFMVVALLVAGLPPLSGFLAKLSLLTAITNNEGGTPIIGCAFFALVLVAGLAAILALSRAGIEHIWSKPDVSSRVRVVEAAAVLALISSSILLSVGAEPVMRYTRATAESLHAPKAYIDTVLSAKARPKVSPAKESP
jgi:multicomponent K+:H+ antiporter subunit D